jgi:hypothetical protein
MKHVAPVNLTATESDGIVVISDLKYPAADVVGTPVEKIFDIISIDGFTSIESERVADRYCPCEIPKADSSHGRNPEPPW